MEEHFKPMIGEKVLLMLRQHTYLTPYTVYLREPRFHDSKDVGTTDGRTLFFRFSDEARRHWG